MRCRAIDSPFPWRSVCTSVIRRKHTAVPDGGSTSIACSDEEALASAVVSSQRTSRCPRGVCTDVEASEDVEGPVATSAAAPAVVLAVEAPPPPPPSRPRPLRSALTFTFAALKDDPPLFPLRGAVAVDMPLPLLMLLLPSRLTAEEDEEAKMEGAAHSPASASSSSSSLSRSSMMLVLWRSLLPLVDDALRLYPKLPPILLLRFMMMARRGLLSAEGRFSTSTRKLSPWWCRCSLLHGPLSSRREGRASAVSGGKSGLHQNIVRGRFPFRLRRFFVRLKAKLTEGSAGTLGVMIFSKVRSTDLSSVTILLLSAILRTDVPDAPFGRGSMNS